MNRPLIYTVYRWHQPIRVRSELKETKPGHADMLRYDLAFHNPQDPSQVIFPIFNYPGSGRSSSNITLGRWQSFSCTLEAVCPTCKGLKKMAEVCETCEGNGQLFADYGKVSPPDWITYRHPKYGDYILEPQTLGEYLAENPKAKIVGWR